MDDRTRLWLNNLPRQDAVDTLRRCCGSSAWCAQMGAAIPFATAVSVFAASETAFDNLAREDWLEAFACHPKIGDLNSLKMKYAGNREWSSGEQAGVDDADDETLQRLAAGNRAYEERFGFLFIVCASGKSAREMLALLEARLDNSPADELSIAAGEQRKITQLRLKKMSPPSTM